jgi:hypothetical protein
MGADMTIAICARHVDRDVAEARLRTLDNAVIGAAYNYGDKIDDDDITDYVSKAIGDLVWVYEYTRATTVFFIEGKEYVLSGGYSWGGYSWGDYPTDAYYPLNVISELGVTELDFEKGVTQ